MRCLRPGTASTAAAGLVLHVLGRLSTEGEVVVLGYYEAEVVDMDERRIDKLLIRKQDRRRGSKVADTRSNVHL